MSDARVIWCEDQYQVLGLDTDSVYFGREKGDRFIVYARDHAGGRGRRRILQSVELDRDWYWDADANRLQTQAPEQDAPVVKRCEHVLTGYTFKFEDVTKTVPWLENLSSRARIVQRRLESGAQATFLIPNRETRAERWLVSLHGGPESFEGCEIRYQGLYRELLRADHGVVILNYVGSTGLSEGVSQKAWGRWSESIAEDVACLEREGKVLGFCLRQATLFGVSFGGALALLIAQQLCVRQVILSSPLLDLSRQRRRGDHDFHDWFDQRFRAADDRRICIEAFADVEVPVSCFWSQDDEVLGAEVFALASKALRSWTFAAEAGAHAPTGYFAQSRRFREIRRLILAEPVQQKSVPAHRPAAPRARAPSSAHAI